LSDLGISVNALQRLVNHFGSQDALIESVRENIYVLTSVDLFGFVKVDEYAMNRGDDPVSPYRIKAAFEHIIKQEGNDGHSWVHIDEFIKKAEDLLKIETSAIVNMIEQLKENPGKFYFKEEKVSLKLYYLYEA